MPRSMMHLSLKDKEKRFAASRSVAAAVGLTAMKIVVGLATGSLGILAEAAHSALDLAAAVTTYFAVRIAGVPADRNHLYGHGKVENLSALFETLLLLVTCAWIIHHALHRVIFHHVEIEVNIWSFLVMTVSIVVDVSRSRVLYRAARKYNSQALEADALHFRTDIWSSAVVILGLACVKASEFFPRLHALLYADAAAAILVALIVVKVSVQLGMRSIRDLLDTAPPGLEQEITKIVESQPGVIDCHNVRLRASGSVHFIDLHILVDGSQSLRQAHELTDRIEKAVQAAVPDSDVTVHPEPDDRRRARSQ